MSGIAIIMPRDQAPVKTHEFTPMMTALAHRGIDGATTCEHSGAVLGYQHFWLTPEEQGERQPLFEHEQQLALLFDGRLDNREELLVALQQPQQSQLSDAAIVLLAYQQWQERCFERLLGPFAIVIHDALQQRVVMARDLLGDRTLFYYLDHRLLLIASEECALLTHPAVSRQINEAALIRFMALHTPDDGSTFFAAIRELPMAHVMTIDRDYSRSWCYAQLKIATELNYRSDDEYAEHFLECLTKSVQCRLRTATPPAFGLSGGLDSTSVAALAARDRATAPGNPPPPLRTFSWIFDELKSCDEREYSETLTDMYGMEKTYVKGDDCWPLKDPVTWPVNPNGPYQNPYRRLKERLFGAVSASGSRVLLTGIFGDSLYAGQREWLADWLREGRWLKASQELLWQLRFGWWHPFLSEGLRCLARQMLDHLPGANRLRPQKIKALDWLTPYAASRLPPDQPIHPVLARRPKQYATLANHEAAWDSNREIRNANLAGIELWHPYRDRRLIEFMLAVPAYQLFSRNQNKYILRNALRDITSEKIRRRLHPTPLLPLYARGLVAREENYVNTLLKPANSLWSRYIRPAWLGTVFPDRVRNQLDGAELVIVWQCISLELWLRKQPELLTFFESSGDTLSC